MDRGKPRTADDYPDAESTWRAYRNPQEVVGPFEVAKARRTGDGSDGGIMDRALVGRDPEGRRVIFAEVWAAGNVEGLGYDDRMAVDAPAMAEKIARLLGNFQDVRGTVQECMDLPCDSTRDRMMAALQVYFGLKP